MKEKSLSLIWNRTNILFSSNTCPSHYRPSLLPEYFDVEYIYGFVWWGVCKQSRWRHSVIEPSEDSGYVLLWQRYDNNKMVAMRYYGNVSFCCWRCVYWACYRCFYIFNSTVIDWTCYIFFSCFLRDLSSDRAEQVTQWGTDLPVATHLTVTRTQHRVCVSGEHPAAMYHGPANIPACPSRCALAALLLLWALIRAAAI